MTTTSKKSADEISNRKAQLNRLTAYKIVWTEFERGWGQRPDGVSYHLTKEAANQFLEKHQCHGDSECYSRGNDPVLVEIDETLANELSENDAVWRRS